MNSDRFDLPPSTFDKPILILGGSGFIGTRLASVMAERGQSIRIGDQRPSERFPEFWRQCDVRDRATLVHLCEGASAIVNLAAEHRDNVRPESRYYETNVKGASEVCASATEAHVSKIIFTSSVAVYGFHSRPIDENGPFAPFNAYGRTKLDAEQVYTSWAREDASRTLVIIRPTVVFGESNRGNVYNLMRQIAQGTFFMVGSGTNIKSIAYVGNLAEFLAHTFTLGPGIHVFNYVDGPDQDMNTLTDLIRHTLNGESRKPLKLPKAVAMSIGHVLDVAGRVTGRQLPISAVRVRKFCANSQFRADKLLETGFRPRYTLKDAIIQTVKAEFGER